MWAAFWVLVVPAMALALQTNDVASYLGFLPVLVAFATVGAVVVARRPRNRIGWLCCAVGVGSALQVLAMSYTRVVFAAGRGWLVGGWAMGWLALWLGTVVFGLTSTFLPLLFPTGRLPSRRWRPVAWAAAAVLVGGSVLAALMPGPADSAPGLPQNPLGIGAAEAALRRLDLFFQVGFLVVSVLCAASLFGRFRRARGVERQQLKWFSYGVALLVGLFAMDAISAGLGRRMPLGLSNVVFAIGFALIPVTAGIAILRYRLYDIDRLINRTLVYAVLTVLLGLGYAVGVVVFGQLLGQRGSSLAVAASTLAVAAVFQPARRRVQAVVDRRFNRHRYNAAATIEAFSSRLRTEVDLGSLMDELLAVVNQTMEPTKASLWLRAPVGSGHGTDAPPKRNGGSGAMGVAVRR